MAGLYLDSIHYVLGDRAFSVEESAAAGRLDSAPETFKEAGFATHHLAAPGTSAYELAKRAVEPLRGKLGAVETLFYCTCLPASANVGDVSQFAETKDVSCLMDFAASRLQVEFGLEKATVVGVGQQACTGIVGALRLARGLAAAEPGIGPMLLVSADRFPDGAKYERFHNLVSDGAVACLVSGEAKGWKVLSADAVTNGRMVADMNDSSWGTHFSITPQVVNRALERAGVGIDQVRWIVSENINPKPWKLLIRVLKVKLEQIYYPTLGEAAHVIGADNLMNLARLSEEGKAAPGDKVVLFSSGYGFNWQCAVLERV